MKPVMGFPGPSHPSEPPHPRTPSLLMHGHAPPPGSLPSLPTQSSWHSVKSVLTPLLTLEQVYPSPTLPPTHPCPDQDLGGSFRRDNLFVSRALGPSRWQEKHKLERISKRPLGLLYHELGGRVCTAPMDTAPPMPLGASSVLEALLEPAGHRGHGRPRASTLEPPRLSSDVQPC